jgi:crotonobetainyl-CoA:carnitine CoA-transferase CaiB-like acyl-CoA transferase
LTDGLLTGLRIIDAGIWRPMPHATQLLADLGAEVIKIEPPGGDPMRGFPQLFRDLASHKTSEVLDLRSGEGRARALELAAGAHVFCEGWRPGVAARLGVAEPDIRAVNPSIIYCSLSGYGQTGEYVDRPGHDVNYQALAGALAPRGDDVPSISRVPIADLAAGTMAALTISAAWARWCRTGEGEHIDLAMADVVASWVGPADSSAMRGRAKPVSGSPGYGVFRAADGGYLALGVIAEDHFWRAVCDALDLGPLRDLDHAARLDQIQTCNDAVAAVVATLDRDDAVQRLADAGAPVTPVLTPSEMAALDHFRDRGVISAEGRVSFPARLTQHPVRPPGPTPELPA